MTYHEDCHGEDITLERIQEILSEIPLDESFTAGDKVEFLSKIQNLNVGESFKWNGLVTWTRID